MRKKEKIKTCCTRINAHTFTHIKNWKFKKKNLLKNTEMVNYVINTTQKKNTE